MYEQWTIEKIRLLLTTGLKADYRATDTIGAMLAALPEHSKAEFYAVLGKDPKLKERFEFLKANFAQVAGVPNWNKRFEQERDMGFILEDTLIPCTGINVCLSASGTIFICDSREVIWTLPEFEFYNAPLSQYLQMAKDESDQRFKLLERLLSHSPPHPYELVLGFPSEQRVETIFIYMEKHLPRLYTNCKNAGHPVLKCTPCG